MAGKVTVGTVYLKVQPDLDGFRRKVEQGTKGLNDVELDVNPDMDGFRQKVKSATKGMKADVDVVANTKRMIADTKAAMKKISDDAQRQAQLRLMADFAHASADRKLKRFIDKANATSVVHLKVADLDKSQTSKVSDQIERVVSRDPVKIRFAVQRDQLNRAMDNVRTSLKKFGPGTQRYIQLSLGTSPKDSGSQRKMLAYLDQVKAKVDKLKKPVSTPWEQWDGKKQLKDFNTDLGSLHKELSKLRKLDHDSWMIGQVGTSRDKDSLPKLTRQLYEASQAHRELVKRSRETGKAFPEGYQEFTDSLQRLQRELGATEKQYTSFTKRTRDLSKSMGNLVHKQTMREIRKEQLLRNQAVASAVRGYKKVADSATKASQKVSEETVKSIQRTKEQYTKSREALRGVNLLPKSIQRQMRLANAIDPGNKVSGSRTGQLVDRLTVLRSKLKEYSTAARDVSTETRRIAFENRRAASSFSNLNKKATKNTGFGGRRRRGLKSIDEVGTERFAGLSRIGWIMSAIGAIAAPVVQLVSGLVAALPALGGAALAALGVTLLGLDGIKEAAQAAAPALERAKEAVSGVFQTRLTPQFEQLGTLLDNITPQLETMAHGMSDFSQGITDGLTSATGTGNIQKLLENSAGLFSKMKPFATDFTEGLLEMAAAGSETFPSLADGMNRFGSSFRENIARLSDSGQLQDAIQATYDVVGSLGTNLGRILSAGIESAPSMAESLIPLFDGIADGVEGLMPTLSAFSEFVGPVLGQALSSIGDISSAAAPGLSDFFSAITPGAVDLLSGAGSVIESLVGPVSSLVGAIGPGVGDVFSKFGQDLEEMANTIKANPQLATELDALGRSLGGLLSTGASGEGFLGSGKPLVSESDIEMLEKITSGITHMVDALKGIDIGRALWDGFTLPGGSSGISDWIGDKLFGEQVTEIKFTPRVTVEPEIDMAGAMSTLSASTMGPMADLEATIEQFKVNAQAVAGEVGIDITPQINILETATSAEQFTTVAQDIITRIKDGVDTTPTEIDPNLTISQSAPVDTAGVTDGVKAQVETDINSALSAVDVDMSTAAASIGSQLGDALGGVDVPMDGLVNSVTSQIDGLVSEVSGKMSEVTSAITSAGDEASSAFTGSMSGMSSESIGIVSGMASAIQSALSMDLTSNGVSVGKTFAAGLASTYGDVYAAAASLAAAVDANMPHSPAKEGPLSGKGWVDTSGIAVGVEFAAGIRSTVGEVADATQLVAGAVTDQLNDFQIAPQANMEAFQKDVVLQPVLESNAKKIADYRKREAERAEKFNERMGKIDENKSKADKKEEQRVKAREDLAKQSAESYEKLLESLEEPDYGKIDRSIQGYWIDGYKDVFKDVLKSSMSAANFTGALQSAVKGATSQIRETLGDHPILAQVEANVDADAFHWAVYNAIEESGIHEVPINLALANVDQFKRDLGMGDGVLSRALDQAISFDPGRSDARRYEEQKEEVHYHVTDMEEAIRLHQQAQRKELMKIPR